MSEEKLAKPVSMYVLFARMFAIVAKNLEEEFGQRGLEILSESVKDFGNARGRDMAERAKAMGVENTLENYLTSYDMERSELFGYETELRPEGIFQEFDRCVFAETWMNDGDEKYGRIYCNSIDPAIAEGYNAQMECVHDEIMYDNKRCTFCFRMKK